jgi:hypothetical protein
LGGLLLTCGAALSATCLPVESIGQWQRWTHPLTSSFTYTNPYKNVTLQATFTCGSTTVTNYGFWDGTTAKDFKIRTALPTCATGNWHWQTSCSSSGEANVCSSDSGLLQCGDITVTAPTNPSVLYQNGFLTVSASNLFLNYSNSTRFPWQADTAWAAPTMTNFSASNPTDPTADWNQYLADRAGKGFNVVIVAPAPNYNGHAEPGTAFTQLASCTSTNPVPNACSTWIPSYWQRLDAMVQQANDSGVVVLIAGLIDPVDLGTGASTYPTTADATTFARNLAARMAGSFVLFSPGYDDKITTAVAGGGTVQGSMNAVGNALVTAAPRHLRTDHLAGSSQYSDYFTMDQSWVNFLFFQSGHAINVSNSCPSGPTDPVQCAMYRARTLAYILSNFDSAHPLPAGTPLKPVVNGEGPYQVVTGTTNAVDTRFNVRHAGYLSTLSGAFGYTVGVTQAITLWTAPTGWLGARAAQDANLLTVHYNNNPRGYLLPQPGWILNNPAQEDQKMALGVNVLNKFAIAYMPNNGTLEISNASGSGFPGLSCGSPWTITWFSPRAANETTQGTCNDTIPGKVVFTRPTCADPANAGTTGNCVWGIEIKTP